MGCRADVPPVEDARPYGARENVAKTAAIAGSVLAVSVGGRRVACTRPFSEGLFVMSLVHSAWIDQVLADSEHLEYGGLLEVVSFITLVAMIALAGLSVAVVTLLYAI